jgi:hypothetical protein
LASSPVLLNRLNFPPSATAAVVPLGSSMRSPKYMRKSTGDARHASRLVPDRSTADRSTLRVFRTGANVGNCSILIILTCVMGYHRTAPADRFVNPTRFVKRGLRQFVTDRYGCSPRRGGSDSTMMRASGSWALSSATSAV